MYCCKPKALYNHVGISPQPPPVCSIHLDDTATATGQRHQCAHHTPATGGEERESHRANQVYAHTSYRWRGERVIEPIKCMHTPATGGEERESYGAFPLHGTVRFGTARYGTVHSMFLQLLCLCVFEAHLY